MADVDIKFEREGLEGIVAVDTYICDAMRRFGIRVDCERVADQIMHDCTVRIVRGMDLLTPRTQAERAFFLNGSEPSKRLACEAKIQRPGEIVLMTEEKVKEAKKDDESDRYLKEFADLPLDKKIADLVKLEAMALGDTISFIFNSPYKLFDKIGDVMAGFGRKLDAEKKKASRPSEHQEQENESVGDDRSTREVTERHA